MRKLEKKRQLPVVVVHGLKRLESTRQTSFKLYVVRVAARYKEVLAPEFWAAKIVYRRYSEAQKTKKNISFFTFFNMVSLGL